MKADTIVVGGIALGLLLVPLLLIPDANYGSVSAQKAVVMMAVVLLAGIGCFFGGGHGAARASFALPLILFCALAIVQSSRALNADVAIHRLSILLGGASVALPIAWVIDDRGAKVLVRTAAIGGFLVSLLGILEFLGVDWAMLPSAGRPSATFGFRNIAGMYLAATIPLCALLFFQPRRLDFGLGTIAITAMAIFLIFTRTRGAWLGVVVVLAMGVMVLWRVRDGEGNRLVRRLWGSGVKRPAAVFCMIGLCVCAALISPRFEDRSPSRIDEKKMQVHQAIVSMTQPEGDRGRLGVWANTLEMVIDYPFRGVGFGNWSPLFPRYDQGETAGIVVAPKRPHNDLLWFWAELGTMGLLLCVWMIGAVLREVWRSVKLGRETAPVAVCASGSVVALCVHGLFSFPSEQPAAMLPFGVAIGLAGRVWEGNGRGGLKRRIWGLGFVGIGLCGLWSALAAVQFDAHRLRAIDAQRAGAPEEQVAEAQRARASGVFDHRILLLLGEGMMALGRYSEAVETYRDYLDLQPYLPAVHNNLGRAYEALGDYEKAEAAYRAGLATFLGDGRAVLQNNLAAVYKKQGRVDEALAIYRAAPQLTAEGYHNLGLILAERGAFSEAQTAYEHAIAASPDMTIAYFSLAGVKMLSDDFEGAAADYETFLKRWDGVQDYVRDAQKRLRQLYPALGDHALKSGDLQAAERAYLRLVELGEETPEIHHNLSIIYGRTRRYEAAIAAAHRALVLDSEFAPGHLALAMAYESKQERQKALRHYRRFLSLWRGDSALKTRVEQRVEFLNQH